MLRIFIIVTAAFGVCGCGGKEASKTLASSASEFKVPKPQPRSVTIDLVIDYQKQPARPAATAKPDPLDQSPPPGATVPTDPEIVLRYQGTDIGNALAEGNRLNPSFVLAKLMAIPSDQPQFGILPRIRVNYLSQGSHSATVVIDRELSFFRKSGAAGWELTAESARMIETKLQKCLESFPDLRDVL